MIVTYANWSQCVFAVSNLPKVFLKLFEDLHESSRSQLLIILTKGKLESRYTRKR